MKAQHSNIILDFVPGGTTGVWQACDVGIQHIFKHSLKCSYHEDDVAVILMQINDGMDTIEVDKKLGILQDQSVSWIWKAYQTLNKPEIVKKGKALTLYLRPEFLLSSTRPSSHELKMTDPDFLNELIQKTSMEAADITTTTCQKTRTLVSHCSKMTVTFHVT
jgi:hypothetical protein